MPQIRTLDEVREALLSMPFAKAMQLEIESCHDDVGVVSIPLSDVVTYDGAAFAGPSIGALADLAAGAATFGALPRDQVAVTAGIDSKVTAPTQGSRLSARAVLRERVGPRRIFDAVIEAHLHDGTSRVCGSAIVAIHVPRPRPDAASSASE